MRSRYLDTDGHSKVDCRRNPPFNDIYRDCIEVDTDTNRPSYKSMDNKPKAKKDKDGLEFCDCNSACRCRVVLGDHHREVGSANHHQYKMIEHTSDRGGSGNVTKNYTKSGGLPCYSCYRLRAETRMSPNVKQPHSIVSRSKMFRFLAKIKELFSPKSATPLMTVWSSNPARSDTEQTLWPTLDKQLHSCQAKLKTFSQICDTTNNHLGCQCASSCGNPAEHDVQCHATAARDVLNHRSRKTKVCRTQRSLLSSTEKSGDAITNIQPTVGAGDMISATRSLCSQQFDRSQEEGISGQTATPAIDTNCCACADYKSRSSNAITEEIYAHARTATNATASPDLPLVSRSQEFALSVNKSLTLSRCKNGRNNSSVVRYNSPADRLVGLTIHCLLLSLLVMGAAMVRWTSVLVKFVLYLALHTAVYKGTIAPLREDTDEVITQDQLREATMFASTGLKIVLLQYQPPRRRALEGHSGGSSGQNVSDVTTATTHTTGLSTDRCKGITTSTSNNSSNSSSSNSKNSGRTRCSHNSTCSNDSSDSCSGRTLKSNHRLGDLQPRHSLSKHSGSSSQDISHIFSTSSN